MTIQWAHDQPTITKLYRELELLAIERNGLSAVIVERNLEIERLKRELLRRTTDSEPFGGA